MASGVSRDVDSVRAKWSGRAREAAIIISMATQFIACDSEPAPPATNTTFAPPPGAANAPPGTNAIAPQGRMAPGTATAVGAAPPAGAAPAIPEPTPGMTAIPAPGSQDFPVLGGIGADVDKERTNLFLNGEPVGFNASGTGEDGRHWADPERTTVELLGESCTTFKSSTRSNIFVEFGCEPRLLF